MEYVFLGLDSLIVTTFYYVYNKKMQILSNIQSAREIDFADKSLTNGDGPSVIEYAMVVGRAKPDSVDLISHYNKDYHGVIRVLEIREHGTNLRNNITSDTTKLISRVVNWVPFNLLSENKNNHKQVCVQVEQPMQADYILEDLTLSHKKFDPVDENVLSRLVSLFVANETVRGIETTEQILATNTEITGFGRLEKISPSVSGSSLWVPQSLQPHYRLSEPTLKGHSFIVTSLSRQALVDRLKTVTRTLKVCMIIFGSIGLALGAYCTYKAVSSYLETKRREERLNQARLQRLKNQRARAQRYDDEPNSPRANGDNQPTVVEQSTCVICLTNPRELVLLDCGHVCLCMDCFERMPSNTCPICRTRYRTFAPCYIP